MSNMKMMHNINFDNATLSTAGVNELLPVTSVQIDDNSEAFRTDTLTNVVIRIKHETPVVVSGLIPHLQNLSATATIQWKGYISDDWSGEAVLDSGVLPALLVKALGEFQWGIEPMGATIFDAWRNNQKTTEIWHEEQVVLTQEIIINDPDNQDGFIDITRIYNGYAFVPTWNFSEGVKMNLLPVEDEGIETADGAFHTVESDIRREIEFNLNYLKESERPIFVEFTRLVGIHKDFYVSLYPDAANQKRRDYAMATKFKTIPSTTYRFHDNYAAPIVGREV